MFIFTPKIGEDSHFDKYFSNGLKPPSRFNPLFVVGLFASQELEAVYSQQDLQVSDFFSIFESLRLLTSAAKLLKPLGNFEKKTN